MKQTSFILLIIILLTLSSCGIYSLSGAKIDAKTIQVNYFPNNANLVEPTISQKFTIALQNIFLQQSSLNLVKTDGELQFEGEIIDYIIRPTAASAQQTADMNRLTIKVKVRFYNKLNEDDNFEQTFSHFYDYEANQQLSSVKDDAFDTIFERITQDIFNASVAKW